MTAQTAVARMFALVALVCLLPSCRSAGPAPAAGDGVPAVPAPELREFVLGPGDEVSLTVWRHPELDVTSRVSSAGFVSVLPLGEVQAGGLGVTQFREKLQESMERYYREPRIKVEVVSSRRSKVYLLGEVDNPGAFPIDDTLNVVQALALAGGLTPDANKKEVVVVRGSTEEAKAYILNFKEAMKSGDLTGNAWLAPGDIVYVPSSWQANLDRFMAHVRDVVAPLLDLDRIRALEGYGLGNSSTVTRLSIPL